MYAQVVVGCITELSLFRTVRVSNGHSRLINYVFNFFFLLPELKRGRVGRGRRSRRFRLHCAHILLLRYVHCVDFSWKKKVKNNKNRHAIFSETQARKLATPPVGSVGGSSNGRLVRLKRQQQQLQAVKGIGGE